MNAIYTASANGRTGIGPTPNAALAELAKLAPVHRLSVTHGTMYVGNPDLEIIPK